MSDEELIKPEEPIDVYELLSQINHHSAEPDSRPYVLHGEGRRLYRIVAVERDEDGDLIIRTEP